MAAGMSPHVRYGVPRNGVVTLGMTSQSRGDHPGSLESALALPNPSAPVALHSILYEALLCHGE